MTRRLTVSEETAEQMAARLKAQLKEAETVREMAEKAAFEAEWAVRWQLERAEGTPPTPGTIWRGRTRDESERAVLALWTRRSKYDKILRVYFLDVYGEYVENLVLGKFLVNFAPVEWSPDQVEAECERQHHRVCELAAEKQREAVRWGEVAEIISRTGR